MFRHSRGGGNPVAIALRFRCEIRVARCESFLSLFVGWPLLADSGLGRGKPGINKHHVALKPEWAGTTSAEVEGLGKQKKKTEA
jgi:hypothetical protein